MNRLRPLWIRFRIWWLHRRADRYVREAKACWGYGIDYRQVSVYYGQRAAQMRNQAVALEASLS